MKDKVHEQSYEDDHIFYQILDQTPTLFVITDPIGRIEYVNKAFTSTMEYSLEELKGKVTFFNATNPEGLRVMQEITEAMGKNRFWQGDIEVVTKSGMSIWLRGLLFTVRKMDGNELGVAAYNDITREITMKREQFERQQVLLQKSRLESLGELSAGLAHEITQPLSVISLVMENIIHKLSQGQVNSTYLKRKFGTIHQNLGKIQQLIDHIRIFSRDQTIILFDRVDVNKCIHNALSMVGTQFRNQQIRVVTDLCHGNCQTLGNASRFEQVILNLLTNAKDALEEREKQFMSPDLVKEIHITTRGEEDRILVSIWDNGTGISPENQEHLFNPFFTTKGEGRGTGLGLPIVYGIIQEMKGEIRVKSQVNVFTEMTIILPRYQVKNVNTSE